MISKFKLFEAIYDSEPEKGEYAYVKLNGTNISDTGWKKSDINNKIFKIIDVFGRNNIYKIDVGTGLWIYRDEILAHSNDKDNIIINYHTKKYNL